MATIIETLQTFNTAVQDKQIPQVDYIKRVLTKDKQLDEIERKDCMHLCLPGNVHLSSNQKLTDADIEVLCKLLHGNTYITSIDLRYNRITNVGAQHLAKAIQETKAIEHINLNGNDIEEEGAKVISAALQENETVKEVRMRSNNIGNAGGMAFAQMLQVNRKLEKLDLSDTNLKTEAVTALATVMKNNKTLQFLQVNRPLLFTQQEEPTVHFAQMLRVNATLKGLSLRKYDMRDFGVSQIAENLLGNMCLTHLDLSCNRITRDGMEELAKVLKKNTALTHLDLSNNRLECAGAKFLAEALAHYNTIVLCVNVRFNNIKGDGLCKIADAMKYNTCVNSVYIWGNVLEESACIAFNELLEHHRFDQKDLDVRPYIVDGVTHLCEMNQAPDRFDYWKPVYGDDIPDSQV